MIRSTVFNVAFFVLTAVFSIVYIPGLLLPRKAFVALVRFWLRTVWVLERAILGLDYRVEGLEHIPAAGSFIIAAKHQSAYETLKMHLIFRDPVIILKKELLWIPLFGSYLKKSGAIAIDRSTPESALRSIEKGALRARDEGSAILIFPQGTRVRIDATTREKPYRSGIARIQQATDLPVLPLALNSGVFWGRNSWRKSGGIVTFKIMAPIPPGKERQELMSELEEKIERNSAILVAEARMPRYEKQRRREIAKTAIVFLLLAGLGGGYAYWWKQAEQTIRREYASWQKGSILTPEITGFPFAMHIRLPEETILTPEGEMLVKDIHVRGFPLPLAPVTATASSVTISSFKWAEPLTLENVEIHGRYWNGVVTVDDSLITDDAFRASAKGTLDFRNYPPPQTDMVVSFMNHAPFLQELANRKILDPQGAMLMSAGFSALMNEDGIVSVPISQRGNTLYAGPFAFAKLPIEKRPLE